MVGPPALESGRFGFLHVADFLDFSG